MTLQKTNPVEELKKVISKEKIIIKEISLLSENLEKVDEEEKQIVFSQINQLKNSLREVNKNLPEAPPNTAGSIEITKKQSRIVKK